MKVRDDQPRHAQLEEPAPALTPPAAPEAQLRAIFDAMACGVVIADAAGHIVDANEAARQILGLPLNKLRGRTLPQTHRGAVRLDGSAIPLAERPSVRSASSGKAQRHQVFGITRKDGQRRWLQVETVPMLDERGQIRSIVSSFVDITERMQAEEALRSSEERFRVLVEKAPLGVCITDEQGLFETVNDGYCALYGYPRDEMIGRYFADFLPESVRAEVTAGYEQLITTGNYLHTEVTIATKSGEERTMLASVVPIGGPDGRPKIASFLIDISDRKQAEQRLDHLAHHDTLTGLPNRVLFHDRLAQALVHARRHGQVVALLFLDLDGFKSINDTHGHDTGDLLLRAVAQRLRGCVREEDTVARLGGDEFTLLLPNVGSGDNATAVARKVLDAQAAPFAITGYDLAITASVGLALYPFDGSDADTLLRCADMAMYRAKGMGKNTYALYESSS